MELFLKGLNDKRYGGSVNKIDEGDEEDESCDNPAVVGGASRLNHFRHLHHFLRMEFTKRSNLKECGSFRRVSEKILYCNIDRYNVLKEGLSDFQKQLQHNYL